LNDAWTVKAEYSSDAYGEEAGYRKTFERRSPFNFGIEYQRGETMSVGLYSLYGSEIGLSFNIVLDPKRRAMTGILGAGPGARGPAPVARLPIPTPGMAAGSHSRMPRRSCVTIWKVSGPDGIYIEDFAYTATTVQIRIRNTSSTPAPRPSAARRAR
jgi:hypothetical protein